MLKRKSYVSELLECTLKQRWSGLIVFIGLAAGMLSVNARAAGAANQNPHGASLALQSN